MDGLHHNTVHPLGNSRLPALLLPLCPAPKEKSPIVSGEKNHPDFSCHQVFATVCMAVGATIRCLPLLFPALESSFTACCHAGANSQHDSKTPFRVDYQRYRRPNCHGSTYTNISSLVPSPCMSSSFEISARDVSRKEPVPLP